MAQINIRLPDEVSEKAGEVLTPIGLTLNSYLQGIAHHMAETGQIPVVIRQQSVALKPEEVFLEAFIRYRTAYTHLHDIYEEQVSDTTPGGTERLTRCADEVSAALEFLNSMKKSLPPHHPSWKYCPGPVAKLIRSRAVRNCLSL